MEGYDAGGWHFIVSSLGVGMWFTWNERRDLSVPRETQHQLIEDILEHKILVIIGGSQLNILEDQFVNDVIGGQYDIP